ncbi:MAG TPA: permease-like cell division protein FtsX [Acidimicrobiales bacterium]|nr:permease-like cell division protein FtsX [Acidimicrobiales bacterium]
MALSVDYVVRETFTNLRRNMLMTFAAVLTVAVSLSLVGGALLLRQGVNNATIQWKGGVELSIFMQPDAPPNQSQAVESELAKLPEVKDFTYVDQDAAYAEFSQMFANSPDMVESVSAKDLPPSYRVVPKQAEFVEVIGERFKKREGVRDVVYAKDTVDTLLRVSNILQWLVLGVAVVLMGSASLLILNTIRMAIFARRREVAVMKLVGATNWFIRVPFMLEGLVQGVVGAALAFGVVFAMRTFIEQGVRRYKLQLIDQLVVSTSEVVGTGMFLLFVGAAVGAIGSFIAVRRFLDV